MVRHQVLVLAFRGFESLRPSQVRADFINTYEDKPEKNRFHLILSGRERRYLDWAQFTGNKSRTKVIREALKHTIENDPDYLAYLQQKQPAQELRKVQ